LPEEKITVRISNNGKIVVHVTGIKGPSCVDEVLKLLEDIAYVQEIIKTDEYYATPHITQKKKVEVKSGAKI